MTEQEYYMLINGLLEKKSASDTRIKGILKRIKKGTATFQDTAKYSELVSNMFGEIFSERVLDMNGELMRENVCRELLRDRYDDINSTLSTVQTALDAKQGLHLRPQQAAFPLERVMQIAHSLEDPTVADEVIQRRANQSVANVAMSFHDDYIQENAKFRNDAGLDCYITRTTNGKCCSWCSEVAGRYEYGFEPHDVYRRHDNCNCTVTYENGKKRQDVWSKRSWEAPQVDAQEAKPTVLKPEQAAEKEKQNLQYRGLTSDKYSDKINVEIDDFVPCLQDAQTGEILPTEVAELTREQLSAFTEANGWGVDWSDRPADEYVLGLFLQGDSSPQGLISLHNDKGGTYIAFASTAPQNNKLLNDGKQKYIGVGGHLFAAAVEESVKNGNNGCVYGFAVNEKVLKHYIQKFGAEHIPIQHEYQFMIEGKAAQNLIDIYNYERR